MLILYNSAYELYADPTTDSIEPTISGTGPGLLHNFWPFNRNTGKQVRNGMAKRFKDTFSRDVKVHFIGVWYVT